MRLVRNSDTQKDDLMSHSTPPNPGFAASLGRSVSDRCRKAARASDTRRRKSVRSQRTKIVRYSLASLVAALDPENDSPEGGSSHPARC